jgi:general secretion pathway protein D
MTRHLPLQSLVAGTALILSGLIFNAAAQPPNETSRAPVAPLGSARQAPPPAAAPVRAPASAMPTANAAPAPKPGEVLLNFQAADIQAVVKAMSQMTGRNFLLDPRVKGQITIISAKPVSTGAAYQIFLSALKAQGFAAVSGTGGITKIVPAAEAKMNADVNLLPTPRGGEQIMTHVLIVQHTSATQMIPLLRPLMSPTSQLSAYEPANALIITDYADNIRRLLRIIEKIDQPVSSDVNIVELTNASALDIADLITRLSLPGTAAAGTAAHATAPGALGGAGDRFSIVPDLRTNSLLIRADNPGRINQLRSLIAKLDVPAVKGGQTHVVYLRNAEATKLVEVLRGLLAGEARTQATASTTAAAAGVGAAGTSKAEASSIQADEATNALIINAPDAEYNNLRAVIEKLDVRRAQVYVEALIVEMSTDAANELGFQWAGAQPQGSGALAGATNFASANPSLAAASVSPSTAFGTSSGLLLAYLGKSVTLPDGTVVRSLGALARALEQRSLANVLSTPNLVTLDNAEAKIMVGQNVPFITGSYAQATASSTSGTVVNPFQTIERKDVGLTLKIKPQVSEGGLIKLDISQEVSSIAPTSVAGASDLITNKRTIETRVVVDDGQTLALGGLIEDNANQTEQAVPILGRIPILGALFRYRQNTNTKTNLMVFLRPVIIHTPQDAYRLTTDRYEYLHAQAVDAMERPQLLERFKPTPPPPPKADDKKNEKDLTPETGNKDTNGKVDAAPTAHTDTDLFGIPRP